MITTDKKMLERVLNISKYKDFDWQNGWAETPERVKECINEGHKRHDVQITRNGSENIVSCDICKYYYKYDCS